MRRPRAWRRPGRWGSLAPRLDAAVPALVGALRDNETGVRWEAAVALGRIGKDSVPALIEACGTGM